MGFKIETASEYTR